MALQDRITALAQAVAADVKSLAAALAGKASALHSHAIGDVTGLQSALDAKADVSVVGDIAAALDAINGV